MSAKVSHPWVHEDEIHLHEGEDHLQQRVDAFQDLMAWRSQGDFEEAAKLESNVDHRAQTES